jgi:hypothetical protein
MWNEFVWFRCQTASSCEHGNEILGSIKAQNISERLPASQEGPYSTELIIFYLICSEFLHVTNPNPKSRFVLSTFINDSYE